MQTIPALTLSKKSMEKKTFEALISTADACKAIYRSDDIAYYVRRHCRQECEDTLQQADLLLRETFVFRDRWDMEPCPEPYQLSLNSWEESPNGDPEWVFMLNRHDFLHKLWRAYWLTAQRPYLEKIRFYMLHWIRSNPITLQGTPATRTIDTGIRCMNWVSLLPLLTAEDLFSQQELEEVLTSLCRQFDNLRRRYIPKYSLSNWGVLQTTAICAGGLWYRDLLPRQLVQWAWQELQQQLELQILEDGVQWEQSPMYHVEVLNACVRLLCQVKLAQQAGQTLPECVQSAISESRHFGRESDAGPGEGYSPQDAGWLVSTIRVMSRHVLYSADPASQQLPICDSDITDVRDVLARAAALLPDGGIYKFAAGSYLDLDSAWILGAGGIDRFEAMNVEYPGRKSWPCIASGNIFHRSDWFSAANFTWMKLSTLGSSHGHMDQTHLGFYYQGKPFLVDPGRYTYREDAPLRMALKNPTAHNVAVIDGVSGGTATGSWSYSDYGEVMKPYFTEQGPFHYAELPFHGTLPDGTPYLIRRSVLWADCGIWLSVQDVICQGKHDIAEYFHLAPRVKAVEGKDGWHLSSGEASLTLHGPAQLTLESSVVSARYNETEQAPLLIMRGEMEDRWTCGSLFTDSKIYPVPAQVFQYGSNEAVSDQIVTAWDIPLPDGQILTFLIWNRETYKGGKVYLCHGTPVYGKAVVLCHDGDTIRKFRLRS